MHPLKIKKNDGFHLALRWIEPPQFILDFFTPAVSATSPDVHEQGMALCFMTINSECGETKMSEDIRIYVADLAAYNNGFLHGTWIEATDAPDDIQNQINEMLAQSPVGMAEEWAVHDHEGFSGFSLGEYESIDYIHEIAFFIEQHGEIAGELLNHFGGSLDDARKAAEEHYQGCWQTLGDFAESVTGDTTEIPQNLICYIDYDRMGRDMEMSGDIFTIETAHDEVHIFWNF